MTTADRQRPRWLTTSPDVVTNLRLVIFGMLCLEAISALYAYAVDPDLAVILMFVAQAPRPWPPAPRYCGGPMCSGCASWC